MKVVEFNGKTYQFAEDLAYGTEGTVIQTLTSGDNQTCELTFVDGQLVDLKEI